MYIFFSLCTCCLQNISWGVILSFIIALHIFKIKIICIWSWLEISKLKSIFACFLSYIPSCLIKIKVHSYLICFCLISSKILGWTLKLIICVCFYLTWFYSLGARCWRIFSEIMASILRRRKIFFIYCIHACFI